MKQLAVKKKDFLTLNNWTEEEIEHLVQKAYLLKHQGGDDRLSGQILGMIFEKSSTRTRISFEVAMLQLGGHAIHLPTRDIQLGRGETIEDTAKVMSRYVSAVMLRTNEHETIERFAEAADVPVINGLSDLYHPVQTLADLLTIYEYKHDLKGRKIVYVGDGNNVAHSLMLGGALMGMDVVIACPNGYEPNGSITQRAIEKANASGGTVSITHHKDEAVQGADAIYTDVWASMGQEEESEARKAVFAPFQVSEASMKLAKPDCLFMHCLPAHRGEEVEAEVLDGSQSVVFDQAENRLHAQKALLLYLLRDH